MPGGKMDQPNLSLGNYSPPWLQNSKMTTMPQGAPGQLAGLARDLAAGGFGSKPANAKWLDQVYDPVRQPQYNAPQTAPKVVKPTVNPKVAPKPAVTPYAWDAGKLVPVVGSSGRNSR